MFKIRRKSLLAEISEWAPWYLSQRVVGCVEDQDLGARCELAGQFCGVQLPIIAGSQLPLRSRTLRGVGGSSIYFPDRSSSPFSSAPISLSFGLHLHLPSSGDSLPMSQDLAQLIPWVPQLTHTHPRNLTSLGLPITTLHSLPASGTRTQGDLQPSLSWVRNN
jgi:hypothetical protein